MRYQLALVIPGDNADRTWWMRVNAALTRNAIRPPRPEPVGEPASRG